MKNMRSFHVGVAAEAFAAGMLAQAGCDISVQYGANQPEYDLIAANNDQFLKISVKGSQDGGWGLIQNYKKKGVTYQQAVAAWVANQSPKVIYCFVQFQGVKVGSCPRVYLATVSEIAAHINASRAGHSGTTLYESYSYKKGVAKGTSESLPSTWAFSKERIEQLLAAYG
jgi:Holliday junction resolvase-like predicted endonuclease